MSNEILINATPTETRVAIVEKGMVQELYLERLSQQTYVGNIYKGKVIRVLPGMQAAFVDINLDRTAFLHVNDIINPRGQHAPPPAADIEIAADGLADESVSTPPEVACITQILRVGQEVDVQVIKDPIGNKGARLSMQISIPSRYLVFLPESNTIGVSVRIEDETERERLREIVQGLSQSANIAANDGEGQTPKTNELSNKPLRNVGYIVRTNAEGVDSEELKRDMLYLQRVWTVLRRRIQSSKAGECIYEELSLATRSMRDCMHSGIDGVRIDNEQCFVQVKGFVDKFMQGWSARMSLYNGDRPIFDLYGIDDEIEAALGKSTKLKSGGYLIIDQTEAMTTVDVNTGGYVGYRNLEETIFKTNLEAAQAIARQLRLRNLGGIIIADFIDMQEQEHQEQVLRTLEKAVVGDHARITVHPFSELGLVQMTRKRVTESLAHRLCEPCQTCNGRGEIKSVETVCFEIFREVVRAVRQFDAGKLLVLAAPAVVEKIHEEHATTIAELEESIDKSIHLKAEDQYSQEQFDVVLL